MEKDSKIPRLITVKEMASILGFHEKVIYRLCRKGVFDKCLVKFGDSMTLRFNSEKVKQAIERGGFKV
jgi:predicted DNA-binding transcriptional regulator AlpA